MAKIDIPTKRLIQLRPEDWVKAILMEEDLVIAEMDPEKNPKVESRLDSLFWVESKEGRIILNIEPQGYYESSLPARMLRYRSDVWEYTMSKGMGIPSIKQVVIFFYPYHDNRQHILEDKREDNSSIYFSYDVIKIWEMEKDYIIENELIGLYSLLPLMKVKKYETPDEIIEETVKAIETIEDGVLKGDILAAMSILSSEKYSSELVKKYVRREMLMNSPLFEEWVREEREEATINAKRDSIIEILIERFKFVPDNIIEELNKIENLPMINQLLKKSLRVETLDEFSKLLEIIIK